MDLTETHLDLKEKKINAVENIPDREPHKLENLRVKLIDWTAGAAIASMTIGTYTASVRGDDIFDVLEQKSLVSQVYPINIVSPKAKTVADDLKELLAQLDEVIGLYPALVVGLEENLSGDPVKAIIDVSVEGKQYQIKKPLTSIPFPVKLYSRIDIEVRQIGSSKKLYLKPFKQGHLDEEEQKLIKEFLK
ncbi:MAG TPA: hypothetical protein VM123_03050 [archaeon]|nr:hypothetical protein [archaeon]